MTKEEAQRECLRRWRARPVIDRQTYTQAEAFAATLDKEIDFRTMADKRRVIEAWLVKDIDKTREMASKI